MTIEKLRDVHRERPFTPFRLHIADGRTVDVTHPELLSMSPSGRTVHIYYQDDRSEFFDLLLVASIELLNGQRSQTGR